MRKYKITIPFPVFVSIEVEAEDEETAEEAAFAEAYIDSYAGNGGSDKLIGVSGSNVSIEAGETPIEEKPFSIEIEEI